MTSDETRPETRCRHCGDPIMRTLSGYWVHIVGPGSVLYNCQHTVPYGQVAEPDRDAPINLDKPDKADRDALRGQARDAVHDALCGRGGATCDLRDTHRERPIYATAADAALAVAESAELTEARRTVAAVEALCDRESTADGQHGLVNVRDLRAALAQREVHQPVVAESTTPGVWNVYCDACSQAAHDYVYPCREARGFPPRQVASAAALAQRDAEIEQADQPEGDDHARDLPAQPGRDLDPSGADPSAASGAVGNPAAAVAQVETLTVALAQRDAEIERLTAERDKAREECGFEKGLRKSCREELHLFVGLKMRAEAERDEARRVIAAVEVLLKGWEDEEYVVLAADLRAVLPSGDGTGGDDA